MAETPARCLLDARHTLAPTDIRVCVACLGRTRRQLAAIERLYDLLPAMVGAPAAGFATAMGVHLIEPAVPGGDVTVMLGPGSASHEGRPDDPPAVAFELWTWVDDWAGIRGERPPVSTTVGMSVDWLSARCGWAVAHHDAIEEFADDLARILARMEAATATSGAPERGATSCPYDGARLVRHWADRVPVHHCVGHPDRCPWPFPAHGCADTGGLDDRWRCPRCHRSYDEDQHRLADGAARDVGAQATG